VQVRVTQNKEPLHMLRLFHGKFVVHEGGNPSSFRNVREKVKASDGTGLYHISGSNEFNTRAVQVEKVARSLNSSDAFVLCEKDQVIVWMGRNCNEDERRTARACAQLISGGRHSSDIEEGKEPADFWAKLGGKHAYPEGLPEEDEASAPRLFQCSNATGVFKSEEIFEFAQDDLTMDDVFILDVSSEVFAWVGAEANETERRGVMDLCLSYIKSGGREGTAIIEVHAGAEPPNFTCHFLGWDHTKAKVFEDPYEAKMKKLKAGKDSTVADPPDGASRFGAVLRKTPSSRGASITREPASSSNDDEPTSNPFGAVLKKTNRSPDKSNEAAPQPQPVVQMKKESVRAQRSAAPPVRGPPPHDSSALSAPTDASGSKIVVKLVKADNLRTNARGQSPNAMVKLRINQDGRASGETFSSKLQATSSEPVWNEEFALPVKEPEKSQLECSIWDESDDNDTPAQKFLGEVVLNLPKLIPYNKTVIEQVFAIKQGKTHKTTSEDKKATGTLKLVLQLIIPDDSGGAQPEVAPNPKSQPQPTKPKVCF